MMMMMSTNVYEKKNYIYLKTEDRKNNETCACVSVRELAMCYISYYKLSIQQAAHFLLFLLIIIIIIISK